MNFLLPTLSVEWQEAIKYYHYSSIRGKKRKQRRKETTNNDGDFQLVKQSQFKMKMLNEGEKKEFEEKNWIVFIVVVSIFDISIALKEEDFAVMSAL